MSSSAFTFPSIPPLMFAQDNQAVTGSPTGAPGATGATTGAPASSAATGGPTPRQPGFFDSPIFLMLMLLVVGLIVMSSMGQRRDRKKREALIDRKSVV